MDSSKLSWKEILFLNLILIFLLQSTVHSFPKVYSPSSGRKICEIVSKPWKDFCSRFLLRGHSKAITKKANETSIFAGDLMKGCQISNCSRCYDETTCLTCNRGYHVQFDSETEKSICVENCFMGYQRSIDIHGNQICKMPGSDCYINHCVECYDIETCSICKRGYFVQFESETERTICVKRCFYGYYPSISSSNGVRACKRIHQSVKVGCLGFGCRACRLGYFLLEATNTENTCLRMCPNGYFKDRVTRKCILKH